MSEIKSHDAGAWTLVVSKRNKKTLANPKPSKDIERNAIKITEATPLKDQKIDQAYDDSPEYDADFEDSELDNVDVDVPIEQPKASRGDFIDDYDEYSVIEDSVLNQVGYDFEKREKPWTRFNKRKYGTVEKARGIRMYSVQRTYMRNDKKTAY